MHTVPIRFGLEPFADIGVTKDAFPDSLALFESMLPLALVDLPIEPNVDTFAVWLVIFEFALVLIAVGITFDSPAIPIIVEPLAFVEPARAIVHHAKTLSLAIHKLTPKDRVSVLLDAEQFRLAYLLVVEYG